MYNIKEITFEEIHQYWIDQKHFHVMNKKINERIYTLGPYTCDIKTPKVQAYGLFDDDILIGTTQIQEWSKTMVRCRAYNIIPEYRGNDLFWHFLSNIICDHWNEYEYIFGWLRENVYGWAQQHGFELYDGIWYDHDETKYIAVIKNINDLFNEE
jgi:hypothetical protein